HRMNCRWLVLPAGPSVKLFWMSHFSKSILVIAQPGLGESPAIGGIHDYAAACGLLARACRAPGKLLPLPRRLPPAAQGQRVERRAQERARCVRPAGARGIG